MNIRAEKKVGIIFYLQEKVIALWVKLGTKVQFFTYFIIFYCVVTIIRFEAQNCS